MYEPFGGIAEPRRERRITVGIFFTSDVTPVDREAINALYGDASRYERFRDSLLSRLAYDRGKLVGAVRVISEGVETALLVDLAVSPEYVGGEAGREEILLRLLAEIEKDLTGRRVMVFGKRENLEIYEKAGYGRCKNAWTLFREGMKESDFLPWGYRFENEFGGDAPAPGIGKTEVKSAEVLIADGLAKATYAEVNEVLTKAFFGRPHDLAKTEKAFSNSQYVTTAFDGERLVGVARAVADGGVYATILNVAVDPEYQGLSIGKRLVRRLDVQIREEVVVLNTHPGAVGFYNRFPEYRRNKYVFEKHIADPVRSPFGATADKRHQPGEKHSEQQTGDGAQRRPANPQGGELGAKRPQGSPADFRAKMFTPAGYRFPDEY